MAEYRSKVSNKYFGTTFAGVGKAAADSELGQIVKVLKTELTPAMQQYGAYQIQEEQDTASKKMMELYNKNPDTVMDEIKSGNHPELESMYTNAVTNLHLGKFAAAKSYQEFLKAKATDYKMDEQDLDSFMSQFVPDMEDKSKYYVGGFSSIWSLHQDKHLIDDANKRAAAAAQKIQAEYTTVAETWAKDTDMNFYEYTFPKTSGLSNKQINETTRTSLEVMIDKAETLKAVDNIFNIIKSDRGDGKSIYTSGIEDDSQLVEKAINKRNSILAGKAAYEKALKTENETRYQNDYSALLIGGSKTVLSDAAKQLLGITGDTVDLTKIPVEQINQYKKLLIENMSQNNYGYLIAKLKTLENADDTLRQGGQIDHILQQGSVGKYNNMTDSELLSLVNNYGGNNNDYTKLIKNRNDAIERANKGVPLDPLQEQFWKDYFNEQEGIESTASNPLMKKFKNNQKQKTVTRNFNNSDRQAIYQWMALNPQPSSFDRTALNQWNADREKFKNELGNRRLKNSNNDNYLNAIISTSGNVGHSVFPMSEIELLNTAIEEVKTGMPDLNAETVMNMSRGTLDLPSEVLMRIMRGRAQDPKTDSAWFKAAMTSKGDLATALGQNVYDMFELTNKDVQEIMDLRTEFSDTVEQFIANPTQLYPFDDVGEDNKLSVEAVTKRAGETLGFFEKNFTNTEEQAKDFPKLREFMYDLYSKVTNKSDFQPAILEHISDEQWLRLSTSIGLRPEELKELTETIYPQLNLKGDTLE
jgi:hypothetical protein